ncbi:hypothetical protein GY45DRAFT_1321959 [Cubamyces sp. BRFM 1775]|nr:hypothetical protein GY45DRAFT_1321959 [Cubamyces sp. BRFM 1775]
MTWVFGSVCAAVPGCMGVGAAARRYKTPIRRPAQRAVTYVVRVPTLSSYRYQAPPRPNPSQRNVHV